MIARARCRVGGGAIARALACVVLAAAVVVSGVRPAAGGIGPDGLVVVPENGSPGLLTLTSDPYPPEFFGLSPGDVVWWQVGAHLQDAVAGALMVRMEGTGDLVTMPGGIEVGVRSCTVPWVTGGASPVCPGTVAAVLGTMRLADVSPDPIPLGVITPSQGLWLLVAIGLPADAGDELQGRRGRFAMGLTASGDVEPPPGEEAPGPSVPPSTPGTPSPPSTPRGDLPFTGRPVATLALAGLGALAGGLGLVHRARRERSGGVG